MVYFSLHELCRQRTAEGGLGMPAPVLATFYTSLDRGLSAFEQCRYLVDTPFPFSWAQLLIYLLVCNQIILPFICVTTIRNIPCGCVLAWIGVQAFWGLNEVRAGAGPAARCGSSLIPTVHPRAWENTHDPPPPPHPSHTSHQVSRAIEDPFAFPPNEIPLARLQYQ